MAVPAGDEAYYLKLKSGNRTEWTAFMKPGKEKKFNVPTGTFDLTYGAGENWYGWKYAFGPEGTYSEASERFNFDSTSCWSVELILQPGGNLGRSGVDYSSF